MNTYTLDVKAFFTINVKADSLEAAIAIVDELDGNEANIGAFPDGSPVVVTLGFDGEYDLLESQSG